MDDFFAAPFDALASDDEQLLVAQSDAAQPFKRERQFNAEDRPLLLPFVEVLNFMRNLPFK